MERGGNKELNYNFGAEENKMKDIIIMMKKIIDHPTVDHRKSLHF